MTDGDLLEKIYREHLDERIIAHLSQEHHLSYEQAMDIYYNSRLAEMIAQGSEGIQYLDHKVLVRMLEETEPEIWRRAHGLV